jgi:hypothetical protein
MSERLLRVTTLRSLESHCGPNDAVRRFPLLMRIFVTGGERGRLHPAWQDRTGGAELLDGATASAGFFHCLPCRYGSGGSSRARPHAIRNARSTRIPKSTFGMGGWPRSGHARLHAYSSMQPLLRHGRTDCVGVDDRSAIERSRAACTAASSSPPRRPTTLA